jgi:hypothetical protein
MYLPDKLTGKIYVFSIPQPTAKVPLLISPIGFCHARLVIFMAFYREFKNTFTALPAPHPREIFVNYGASFTFDAGFQRQNSA